MAKWILSGVFILLMFPFNVTAQSKGGVEDPFAEALYVKHCAQCHDQGADARVPPRAALEKMSPAGVLRALESGAMREMGAKLTISERYSLAALLGKAEPAVANQPVNRCSTA